MDQKLQQHRADSLRQHGFLVPIVFSIDFLRLSWGTKQALCQLIWQLHVLLLV